MPSYGLCDEKYDGMEAEIIYTKLPEMPPKGKRLVDSHGPWEKASEKKEGEGRSGGKQEALARLWQERVARAAHAARGMGKLSGALEDTVRDVLDPKLDWRVILRDMITAQARNDFRLIPPSRKHLWRGIYLPTMEGETLEVAIAVDTSGSISVEQFQMFMAEIRGVTEQFSDYTLHLFFCDGAVHDHIVLTRHDEWPQELPKRGGGTRFTPVFDALDELPRCPSALVYLTDGDGAYPEQSPGFPVIWLLTQAWTVPFGTTILMEEGI